MRDDLIRIAERLRSLIMAAESKLVAVYGGGVWASVEVPGASFRLSFRKRDGEWALLIVHADGEASPLAASGVRNLICAAAAIPSLARELRLQNDGVLTNGAAAVTNLSRWLETGE